jgi:hypothetical protein
MQTEMTIATVADTRTDDQRWAAWVAKGIAHDKKNGTRVIAVAALLASGVALWLAAFYLLA